MAGVEVGTLMAKVVPDARGFHAKLRKDLKKAGDVQIKVAPDLDAFRKELVAGLEKATAGIRIDIPVSVDTSAATRELEVLEKPRKATVDADADTTTADKQLDKTARKRKAPVEADADTAPAERQLSRLERTRMAVVKAVVIGDGGLDKLGSSLGSIGKTLATYGALSGAAVAGVAGIAPAVAAVGVAASQATIAVGGLAAAMAPAALGAAALSVGVLKTAFTDMGAAAGEATQQANAALTSMKTSLADVGKQAQESFWAGFSNFGQLQALIAPVGAALNGVASSMGQAAANFTSFVTAGVGLGAFNTILGNSAIGASNLSMALSNALKGVTLFGAVGAPLFAQLTARINEMAAAWSQRMVAAFQDGSMQAWFDSAIAKVQSFWGVLQNLGGIVSGVFQAMAAAGGGVASVFADVIAKTNQWVNSGPGMAAMTGFFREMQSAVAAVAPLFGQLAQILVTQLAPIMAEVFRTLAPYAADVLRNLSDALTIIAPIVPVVAGAFGFWVSALSSLAPVLAIVADVLGALSPVLIPLAAILMACVAGFKAFMFIQSIMPVLTLFGNILGVIGGVISSVVMVAVRGLATAFTALWGVMMANPIIAIIAAVVAIGVALWAFFTKTETGRQMWANFVSFLTDAWNQLVSTATFTWEMLKAGWDALWNWLVTSATTIWSGIAAAWNAFWNGLVTVVTFVGTMITTAWNFIVMGLQMAFQFFVTLVTTIWNAFWNGLVFVVTLVGTMITAAWNFIVTGLQLAFQMFAAIVTAIWNSFWNGLSIIVSTVGAAISAAWNALWNGVRAVFSAVVNFIRSAWNAAVSFVISMAQRVWSMVSNAFNSMRSAVTSTVSSMWASAKSAFSSGVSAVVSFVSSLPGKIRGFFAGAGSWLISAGRNIMQGLLNGISGMVGAVIGKIRAVGSMIKSAFTGLLGIHSPSRVFMGYGQNLAEGLAIGVEDNATLAESSAQQLASTTDSALEAALPTTKTITPKITADAGKSTVKATAPGSPTVLGKEMQKARRSLIEPAARGISKSMQQMGSAVVGATLGQAAPSMLQMAATSGNAAATVQQNTVGVMSQAFAQTGRNMLVTQHSQIEPALRSTRDSVTQTANTFGPAAQTIGVQWAQVRPATAEPVRYAINTVFNDGIVGMWNSVSELLGTKKMNAYVARFATGGYVSGPGGPTDDKIPAMLSNGEYVIKADTVRKVGVGALDRLNAGARRYPGVVHGQAGREMYNDLTFQNVAIRRQGGGIAEGTPAWEALKRAHMFAQKWSPRPYVWGGSLGANNGTDCSGWVSSIADVILGGNGMVRKWATMSFPGPQQGAWKSGLSAGFSVGISNVHTAGTLSGVAGFPTVNVESGGNTGQGPTYGGRAVGADHPQFNRRYSLIITDMGAFIPGGGGSVMSMGEMVDALMKPAKDKLSAAAKGFTGGGILGTLPGAVAGKLGDAVTKKAKDVANSMGGGPVPDGSGAERWRPMAMRAMARVGFDANNKAQVDAMISQIRSESGGNAGVAQQIHDVNGTGESAGVGLLQIIPGTFAAHRDPTLPNDRRDPFANMVAALRYYKARYGMDLTRMWGHGHGYDMGGWLEPGMNATYNGFSKPEAVLTPTESEAFVGVARRFADDSRAGASYTGQHIENQWVIDPSEITWRAERGVKRAMREESIRV